MVSPDTQVGDAWKLTTGDGGDPLPVVENGRLQGVVFRSQLQNAIQAQSGMKPTILQPLIYGTSKVARKATHEADGVLQNDVLSDKSYAVGQTTLRNRGALWLTFSM